MVIRKLYFQDKVNVSSTIVLLFWNYIFTISIVYSTLYSGQWPTKSSFSVQYSLLNHPSFLSDG